MQVYQLDGSRRAYECCHRLLAARCTVLVTFKANLRALTQSKAVHLGGLSTNMMALRSAALEMCSGRRVMTVGGSEAAAACCSCSRCSRGLTGTTAAAAAAAAAACEHSTRSRWSRSVHQKLWMGTHGWRHKHGMGVQGNEQAGCSSSRRCWREVLLEHCCFCRAAVGRLLTQP